MLGVIRAGTLAITVAVAVGVAASPPVHAQTAGRKCAKEVDRRAKKYIKRRLRKVQRCANKVVKRGKGNLVGCLEKQVRFKKIKKKKCSYDALVDIGFLSRCEQLNPTCADKGVIEDAASLRDCMECHLHQVLNCMVATTYNIVITDPDTPSCHLTPPESSE
jgi:hypothetical protein